MAAEAAVHLGHHLAGYGIHHGSWCDSAPDSDYWVVQLAD
jgi:hypothetical protein